MKSRAALLFLCLSVSCLSNVANAEDRNALMLGEWCGETQKHGYSWRQTFRADGTYETYFESLTEDDDFPSLVWNSGRWAITGATFTEMVVSEKMGDAPEEFLFPSTIYHYEILEIASDRHRLYDPEWDTIFVSTKCVGPATS